jgi:RNA polymerase sigma-70 factor (ECF subfamily)
MSDANLFTDFIQKIRNGDEEAARDLVLRFENLIRCEVRVRLTHPSLYRIFDSMDICQSVLTSFFVRASLGQYKLDRPEDLVRLLVGMARRKLAFHARRERAQRRDHRRTQGSTSTETVAAVGDSPIKLIANREILAKFRQRLTEEERLLVDLRAQGHAWDTIAGRCGGTSAGRRMQLTRAIKRVAQQLDLDGNGNV